MLAIENICRTFNIQIKGQGRPLLFAHGLGCDQNVWHAVVDTFINDYQVILFDYIGSGESDLTRYDKEKYSSLYGYADDILEICNTLNLRDVIFVGHSVSAMIGLLAAVKQPAIFSDLIMIGPSPCYINEPPYMGGFDRHDIDHLLSMMRENYVQWASFFAPKAMGNKERPELSNQLASSFCKADPDITCDFAHVTFLSDNRKDLACLSTPTLILQPAEDIVAPTHVGEYLHQHIAGSTLRYMRATGHFPHLSAVNETVELIKEYLKRK